MVNTIKGLMNLCKETPADFMAVNSKCSPKLPKVMMEESRIAKGNAIGTNLAEAYKINSAIIVHSNPFPAKSSMYFQRNCINRINSETKNVAITGPKNDFRINLCSRFTLNLFYKTITKIIYFM
jgi:hypothetical protein